MGATKVCIDYLSTWEPSDWIEAVGIVVNVVIGVWIVRTIQNRLTNRRILKDHFISEIKDIRNEYKICLSNLYSDQTMANKVIPWFKLMNIKVSDIMTHISRKYNIPVNFFDPYQNELRELITNSQDFNSQFNSTSPVRFSEPFKILMMRFQQDHIHLFNELIIQINDHD